MDSWLTLHEAPLRLGVFLGVFGLMAVLEWAFPRRALSCSKMRRWGANLSIVIINTTLVRLVLPVSAVGIGWICTTNGWGLLNQVQWPGVLELVSAVLLFDLVIYLQHRLFHRVPLLWRLHRVHHADPDMDVTTGARFHPLEILISMLVKFLAIAVVGPPLAAIIIFEVLLNATALFNHSNLKLPVAMDRIIRALLVTPDMHRVHHSVQRDETNSNYGFNLPWWDRIFGSYRDQPRAGHEAMLVGLKEYPQPRSTSLTGLLLIPFGK